MNWSFFTPKLLLIAGHFKFFMNQIPNNCPDCFLSPVWHLSRLLTSYATSMEQHLINVLLPCSLLVVLLVLLDINSVLRRVTISRSIINALCFLHDIVQTNKKLCPPVLSLSPILSHRLGTRECFACNLYSYTQLQDSTLINSKTNLWTQKKQGGNCSRTGVSLLKNYISFQKLSSIKMMWGCKYPPLRTLYALPETKPARSIFTYRLMKNRS